jgi:uncharacterized protein YbaP (TraB family)
MLVTRWLVVLAALLACAFPASSEPPDTEPGPGVPLFLWSLTPPPGQGGPLALLGTVHFGPANATLAPEILEALGSTARLALEVDVSNAEALMERALRRGTLDITETLDEKLSPKTYQELERFLDGRGIPMQGVVRLETWAIGILVAGLQFEASGFTPEHGIEHQLLASARPGLEVVYLETVNEQLSLLDHLPDSFQERLLQEALDQNAESQRFVEEVWSSWTRGDAAGIQRLLTGEDEDPDARAFRDRMFGQRNRRMAERIDPLLDADRPLLVAVGAGHLVGPDGLIALFKARGFQARQVVRRPAETASAPH